MKHGYAYIVDLALGCVETSRQKCFEQDSGNEATAAGEAGSG
ncbi:hypothetical protein ADILRU_0398 [Leifsonia rubra CMS 76R]|nr:hypothetical protein ADILRU_0398 [Leifsonia rubra CMS 76R]